jgi:hypothetical protein
MSAGRLGGQEAIKLNIQKLFRALSIPWFRDKCAFNFALSGFPASELSCYIYIFMLPGFLASQLSSCSCIFLPPSLPASQLPGFLAFFPSFYLHKT